MIATLKSVTKGESAWTVVIVYGNGAVKQHQVRELSDEVIQSLARNDIAAFDAVALSVGKVSLAPGDVIDTSTPVVLAQKAPTIEESNAALRLQKRRELHTLMDDVRDGLLDAGDPRIVKLQAGLM